MHSFITFLFFAIVLLMSCNSADQSGANKNGNQTDSVSEDRREFFSNNSNDTGNSVIDSKFSDNDSFPEDSLNTLIDRIETSMLPEERKSLIGMAKGLLKQAVSTEDSSFRFLIYSGIIAMQDGDFKESEKVLLKAENLKPDQPIVDYNLYTLYVNWAVRAFDEKKYQMAVNLNKSAMNHSKSDSIAINNLSSVYLNIADFNFKKDDNQNALVYIDSALIYKPGSVIGRINRAAALNSLGRVNDAKRQLEEVLIDNPNNRTAKKYLELINSAGNEALNN